MSKKLTAHEIQKRIAIKHGNLIHLDESTYVDTHTKAFFIDKDFGGWWAKFYDVMNSKGHPQRYSFGRKTRKYSVGDVEIKIYEIHGDLVKIDPTSYVRMKIRARFIDKEYGEWWTTPASVIISKSGHPLRKMATIKEKLKTPIDNLIKKLNSLYGDLITIDPSTYKNMNHNAKFIDRDFGEWWTHPTNVLINGHKHPQRGEENRKNTNFSLYGVMHVTQNREIALRAAKNLTKSSIKFHWKSGEEIICQASYEAKTVDYLNNNKIEYLWQPKTFTTPLLTKTGLNSNYRPDLYLIKEDKWVEIKGWMRPKSKPKWDWFQSQYPTAQLWDKKKLKELGILC